MDIDDVLHLNGRPYISLFDAERMVADAAKRGVSAALKELGISQVAPSPYKTTKEAAEYLNTSIPTIRRMAEAGVLKASRHGKVIRYHVDDLDKALT